MVYGGAPMFGNKLGWTISAVIVALAAGFLSLIGMEAGRVSPPGEIGRNAGTYTIQLPVEPAAVIPFGAGADDSGELYLKAIQTFEAGRDRLAGPVPNNSPEEWKPVLDLLVQAGESQRIGVFAARPELAINYDTERSAVEMLRFIGNAAIRLALLSSKNREHDKAERYARAAFALGSRLYYERLTYPEFEAGQDLLGGAATVLARLAEQAGDDKRAALLREFNGNRIQYVQTSIAPVRKAIAVLDPNVGDLAALAEEAPDMMWRVEAILALGRCRYSSERRADQSAARRVCAAFMKSDIPRLRLAAKAAGELTAEQFRKLK